MQIPDDSYWLPNIPADTSSIEYPKLDLLDGDHVMRPESLPSWCPERRARALDSGAQHKLHKVYPTTRRACLGTG